MKGRKSIYITGATYKVTPYFRVTKGGNILYTDLVEIKLSDLLEATN